MKGQVLEKVKNSDPYVLRARESMLIRKFDSFRHGLNKEPWLFSFFFLVQKYLWLTHYYYMLFLIVWTGIVRSEIYYNCISSLALSSVKSFPPTNRMYIFVSDLKSNLENLRICCWEIWPQSNKINTHKYIYYYMKCTNLCYVINFNDKHLGYCRSPFCVLFCFIGHQRVLFVHEWGNT